MDFFTPGELAEFRELAESRMVDTCRITRPGVGKGTFNASTGKYDTPEPILVYEGICRIPKSIANANAAGALSGEASWKVGEYPFAVPITDTATAAIAVGHTVEYLTSPTDPAMVGRVFGIVSPLRQTEAKDRRFKIKEAIAA